MLGERVPGLLMVGEIISGHYKSTKNGKPLNTMIQICLTNAGVAKR